MSTLIEDMTELRDELTALHGARMALREDLRQGTSNLRDTVSGMRSGFRRAHATMAKQRKAEGSEFVSNLRDTVSGMRSGFRKAQAAMAKQRKAEGSEFVSALKQGVADARREFSANLKAAGEAWLGQSGGRSKTRTETEALKEEGRPRRKRKGGRRSQG